MPPKSKEVEKAHAPPPPTPPNPVVIAAEQQVSKWELRVSDIATNVEQAAVQLDDFQTQRTSRENSMKDLFSQAQTAAQPRPKEVDAEASLTAKPGKGAKGKVAAPPPEPVAAPVPVTPDEEDLRSQKKRDHLVMQLFKKKREPRAMLEVDPDSTQPEANEPGVNRPPEIDEDIWARVLNMRDERLTNEDQLYTLRSNIEVVTARQDSLRSIQRLVQYSLDAAKFDLQRAKLAPKVEDPLPAVEPSTPSAGGRPGSKSTGNRPPSQLVKR
jgi:hypothetical protein